MLSFPRNSYRMCPSKVEAWTKKDKCRRHRKQGMQSGMGAVGGWRVEGKEMPGANCAPAESNPSGPKGVDVFWRDLSKRQSGSDGKKSACNAGDLGSISGLRRSPGRGNGNPLQYSCLENPMDRGAWRATVPQVPKSQTWLTFTSLRITGHFEKRLKL